MINPKLLLVIASLLFSATAQSSQAPWIGKTFKNLLCTGAGQGYGPYDYLQKTMLPSELQIVETHHFTPKIEGLTQGKSGHYLIADLDYTLRAWPNHHRALKSVMRYQLELNAKIRKGKLDSPVECYFQRAMNFSPKDTTTLNMYAYFLKKSGHLKTAKKIYQKALEISPNNRRIAYSYSFLLIDLKEYKEALKQAHFAYEKGKAPNKLRNKLKRLGVWKKTQKIVE